MTPAAERISTIFDEPVRRAIAALSVDASIEIVPREVLSGAKAIDAIPSGTRTFIPRLPRGSFEESLQVAVMLAKRGFAPVPHVTARTLAGGAELADQLSRYVSEASVREVLLIAGSDTSPLGAYADTLPIFSSGVLEASGLTGLYVAGHPEGHPDASENELKHAVAVKNDFAARTGLDVKIVSQFFFDAAPVIAWEKRLRDQGNTLPVIPGLHGCTGLTSLIKHAVACGVGASLKALTARGTSMLQLTKAQCPDELAGHIAAAHAQDPKSRFRGFHLFPLGGLAKTVDWARDLQNDRFSITSGGILRVGS